MYDQFSIIAIAVSCVSALSIAAYAALKGWRGWLDLKRLELDRVAEGAAPPSTGSRIEIADLKERVRKLEAIAAGIEL